MYEKEHKNIISEVTLHSKADQLGIEVGDKLIKINDQPIEDIIEYMFLVADEYLDIEIEKKDGSIKKYQLQKEFYEDLGIVFENPIIDQAKSCMNKCMFCFIDQLPPNMRKTLYFKDDDSRLSFLQGNFITLTNMSDHDVEKIIKYRISPINVSIHTTDPTLRVKMLKNKTAGNIYTRLQKLASANIQINGQIVLCPHINDKENLDRTLEDLADLYPAIHSVAIVPVGLTRFREGLYPLTTFNREMSLEVIDQVEKWQQYFANKIHTRFAYLSDEFYVVSKKQLPEYDAYEGFPQIENGVGLMAQFHHDFITYLGTLERNHSQGKVVSIVTGQSAKTFMQELCKKLQDRFSNITINVFPILNHYFGETITVSGLVTGSDILKQLEGKNLGEKLIIPENMLKSGETIFLDDISIEDLQKKLNVFVEVSKVNGEEFINKVIN